jgi:hypothetical protein
MEKLQHVNISVYDDEKCQSIHFHEVHDTNICAGVPEGGRGQCSVSRLVSCTAQSKREPYSVMQVFTAVKIRKDYATV